MFSVTTVGFKLYLKNLLIRSLAVGPKFVFILIRDVNQRIKGWLNSLHSQESDEVRTVRRCDYDTEDPVASHQYPG